MRSTLAAWLPVVYGNKKGDPNYIILPTVLHPEHMAQQVIEKWVCILGVAYIKI